MVVDSVIRYYTPRNSEACNLIKQNVQIVIMLIKYFLLITNILISFYSLCDKISLPLIKLIIYEYCNNISNPDVNYSLEI